MFKENDCFILCGVVLAVILIMLFFTSCTTINMASGTGAWLDQTHSGVPIESTGSATRNVLDATASQQAVGAIPQQGVIIP